MSRQHWDQVVIQNENPELVEKPQRAAVNSFDHIVVSLQKRNRRHIMMKVSLLKLETD